MGAGGGGYQLIVICTIEVQMAVVSSSCNKLVLVVFRINQRNVFHVNVYPL